MQVTFTKNIEKIIIIRPQNNVCELFMFEKKHAVTEDPHDLGSYLKFICSPLIF